MSQTPVERVKFGESDLILAREQLLDLVNSERTKAGAARLDLDDLACRVANEHALDMLNGNFLSHWGRDGRKPYQRYSFAGGIDAVQENVSAAENIQSATPVGVVSDLKDMHTTMLGETPPNDGHRQAILAPQHTHVGFGVAKKDQNLRLVEIYVSRYIEINPIQRAARPKTIVVLTGRLLNPKHFLHGVDVCYEPLPSPPEAEWLRTPRGYALPTDYVMLRPRAPGAAVYADGSKGDYEWDRSGKFRVPAKLAKDQPGIYTIVLWVRRFPADKAFPAAEVCVRCE